MRKNYYIILDTETTATLPPEGNKWQKLAYNIGWTIATKKDIIVQRDFLVYEIWGNNELMNNAYYKSKHPLYVRKLANKEIEILSFNEIMKQLKQDIREFQVKVFSAYNVTFDLDALMQTTTYVNPGVFNMFWRQTKAGKVAPDYRQFCQSYILGGVEVWDLWGLACQALCNQKTFQSYYMNFTKSGNPKTSAEEVYKYITDNEDFEEEHTALSDSIVETHILQRILRQHKALDTTIVPFPYRLIEIK